MPPSKASNKGKKGQGYNQLRVGEFLQKEGFVIEEDFPKTYLTKRITVPYLQNSSLKVLVDEGFSESAAEKLIWKVHSIAQKKVLPQPEKGQETPSYVPEYIPDSEYPQPACTSPHSEREASTDQLQRASIVEHNFEELSLRTSETSSMPATSGYEGTPYDEAPHDPVVEAYAAQQVQYQQVVQPMQSPNGMTFYKPLVMDPNMMYQQQAFQAMPMQAQQVQQVQPGGYYMEGKEVVMQPQMQYMNPMMQPQMIPQMPNPMMYQQRQFYGQPQGMVPQYVFPQQMQQMPGLQAMPMQYGQMPQMIRPMMYPQQPQYMEQTSMPNTHRTNTNNWPKPNLVKRPDPATVTVASFPHAQPLPEIQADLFHSNKNLGYLICGLIRLRRNDVIQFPPRRVSERYDEAGFSMVCQARGICNPAIHLGLYLDGLSEDPLFYKPLSPESRAKCSEAMSKDETMPPLPEIFPVFFQLATTLLQACLIPPEKPLTDLVAALTKKLSVKKKTPSGWLMSLSTVLDAEYAKFATHVHTLSHVHSPLLRSFSFTDCPEIPIIHSVRITSATPGRDHVKAIRDVRKSVIDALTPSWEAVYNATDKVRIPDSVVVEFHPTLKELYLARNMELRIGKKKIRLSLRCASVQISTADAFAAFIVGTASNSKGGQHQSSSSIDLVPLNETGTAYMCTRTKVFENLPFLKVRDEYINGHVRSAMFAVHPPEII